jgi:hypothetical protein
VFSLFVRIVGIFQGATRWIEIEDKKGIWGITGGNAKYKEPVRLENDGAFDCE